MSDTETTTPRPTAKPELRAAQRWNIVWVVPILALLIGGWMIYRNVTSRGPVARVTFVTADGIGAGKTEVRCRSVRVGFVKKVSLSDDLQFVRVHLEFEPETQHLLRKGTRFWVVRPRVSATDISGLGTLITGSYIELDPGQQPGEKVQDYKGLETPPATNSNIPGRRLVLTAEEAGSLAIGSPIYHRGFEVGRIENRILDLKQQRVTYDAFIQEEFGGLVTENTRFWNTSGIDFSAGADGFKVRTPSFQAMMSGGTTFGVPEGILPGNPVADNTVFKLYSDEDDADRSIFNPSQKFVLLFDQSVRGLSKGAPAEFRGIPVGRVADISLDYLQHPDDSRVPVLVEIDPSLLRRESADQLGKSDEEFLVDAVKFGLRASLKTGSLLTGSLYIDLNYYKELPPAEITKFGNFSLLPTIPGGLAGLETKITAILEKIDALPIDETMRKFGSAADEAAITLAESRKALDEIQQTAAALRKTVDSPAFTSLPADVRDGLAALEKSVTSVGPDGAVQGDLLRTLDELRAALRSIKSLTTGINEKPNSLLFGRDSSGNQIPKAPKSNR